MTPQGFAEFHWHRVTDLLGYMYLISVEDVTIAKCLKARRFPQGYCSILGRMAGIEEATLEQLIAAGQTATILGKFDR